MNVTAESLPIRQMGFGVWIDSGQVIFPEHCGGDVAMEPWQLENYADRRFDLLPAPNVAAKGRPRGRDEIKGAAGKVFAVHCCP